MILPYANCDIYLKIKRFQRRPFLWAYDIDLRTLCQLATLQIFFELRKLARVAHFTQPLVQRLTGYKVHCRLKTSEKNFLKPFKKVEFTDSDRVVSDNLELLWSWTLVGSPVRIIRIFAIHTGIFPASIADPVSVIVVKILYLCQ